MVSGVRLSLWRAAVTFRLVSAAFCLYLILRWRHLDADPGLGVAVGAALVVVTAVVCVLGLTGRAHRRWLVLADLACCVVLTLLSHAVQTPAQAHGGMPTLTTVWAAGPVIEAGLVGGWFGGAGAALVQFAATVVVRGGYDGHTAYNGVLLLITGPIAGYLMVLSTRTEDERAVLLTERAALAERERLARSIHDGALQVLALVHRKAAAAGGEWAALGVAAAEQEVALRGLVAVQPARPAGARDLAAELARLRAAAVTVSIPAGPVLVQDDQAGELVAAVRAALHNVSLHAGPDAHAWVLLEELADRIVLTVRDDGAGFEPGRLEQAKAAGRLGVTASIRGRIAALGGTVRISSVTGTGTEVEIELPLADRSKAAPSTAPSSKAASSKADPIQAAASEATP